ncbi:uncharacterized protein DS421_12g359010 [Arachis hypogaea]|nr:uncharacterized protein DS421_12g359010 [Arachis hypogaea]
MTTAAVNRNRRRSKRHCHGSSPHRRGLSPQRHGSFCSLLRGSSFWPSVLYFSCGLFWASGSSSILSVFIFCSRLLFFCSFVLLFLNFFYFVYYMINQMLNKFDVC